MTTSNKSESGPPGLRRRADDLYALLTRKTHRQIDRMFVVLMIVQYLAGIVLAVYVSPQTWIDEYSFVHLHVWIAVVFGAVVSSLPIAMAVYFPGATTTRHVIAIAQGVWSGLLIHLTGGRLETHFHVFGSLAFIAFYRDWRVLLTMTVVVAGDHAVRGIWWPLSVYGVATESPFRWMEHAMWVCFENIVLIQACHRGVREAKQTCHRQAKLEQLNAEIEDRIVTRTKELERSRHEAENLALVARYTDNSVLLLNDAGEVEWVNHGFVKQTGYTLNDMRGHVPIDILQGPETSLAGIQTIRNGLAAKEKFAVEITKHRKDGSAMVLEIESIPIQREQGTQFFQIERDITQRKEDERERESLRAELQENADYLTKLALVAQYTSNAVVITDPQGTTEWVNAGFTRITGYSFEDVRGKPPFPLEWGELSQKINGNPANDRSFSAELQQQRKNGEPYWGHVQINVVENEDGNLQGHIAVLSDITDRKNVEFEREALHARLQASARVAGRAEVAANVLHNVGNVLNSVNVSATLLRERLGAGALKQLKQASDIINYHADDLSQFLLRDSRGKHFHRFLGALSKTLLAEQTKSLDEAESLLLNVGHIQKIVAAQQSLAMNKRVVELTDIEAVFNAALAVHSQLVNDHAISIKREFDRVEPIQVDRHEIQQILINLVRNGIEATLNVERIGTLRLSIRQVNEFVNISVDDNGIGIDRGDLTSIFHYLPDRRKSEQGTSLHESANCATELGGSLTAFSQGVGEGSTFTLRLPVKRTVDLGKKDIEQEAQK